MTYHSGSDMYSHELPEIEASEKPALEAYIDNLEIEPRVKYNYREDKKIRTTSLSMFGRMEQRERKIPHKLGFESNLYLRLRVKQTANWMYALVSPEEAIKFGEYMALNGKFEITENRVSVRFDEEKIIINGFGEFEKTSKVKNGFSYNPRKSIQKLNSKKRQCWKSVDKKLKRAWAKHTKVYTNVGKIDNYYTAIDGERIGFEVSLLEKPYSVEFSISRESVEQNSSARAFVVNDINEHIPNLKGQRVVVSLDDFSWADPIDKTNDWKLYRLRDKPSIVNHVRGLVTI